MTFTKRYSFTLKDEKITFSYGAMGVLFFYGSLKKSHIEDVEYSLTLATLAANKTVLNKKESGGKTIDIWQDRFFEVLSTIGYIILSHKRISDESMMTQHLRYMEEIFSMKKNDREISPLPVSGTLENQVVNTVSLFENSNLIAYVTKRNSDTLFLKIHHHFSAFEKRITTDEKKKGEKVSKKKKTEHLYSELSLSIKGYGKARDRVKRKIDAAMVEIDVK